MSRVRRGGCCVRLQTANASDCVLALVASWPVFAVVWTVVKRLSSNSIPLIRFATVGIDGYSFAANEQGTNEANKL